MNRASPVSFRRARCPPDAHLPLLPARGETLGDSTTVCHVQITGRPAFALPESHNPSRARLPRPISISQSKKRIRGCIRMHPRILSIPVDQPAIPRYHPATPKARPTVPATIPPAPRRPPAVPCNLPCNSEREPCRPGHFPLSPNTRHNPPRRRHSVRPFPRRPAPVRLVIFPGGPEPCVFFRPRSRGEPILRSVFRRL